MRDDFSEHSLTILSPNRGGRPRNLEPSTRASTWMPVREYDRLVKLAEQRDQSVSSLMRDLIRRNTE